MTQLHLTGWAAASLPLLAFTSRDLYLLCIASLGATLGKPWQGCGLVRGFTLTALLLVCSVMPAPASATTYAERMHARAVESFRQGRFPEAYGRFIDLANAGHLASARYALWMCEQGPALFGKDWDCAPHEAEDWARTAGVALPRVTVSYPVTPIRSPRHGGR